MSVTRSILLGCGAYLPEKIMTNEDMAKIVDTSDEWIQERSGIKQRHIAADDQVTSDLATFAADRALKQAGVSPDEVDLIIVATATPDRTFPATAVAVQRRLGVAQGAAFDVQAVCSGFVYALTIADKMIASGQSSTALVIGAETFSRIVDWTDRSTCVLFGDGAGAVVLQAGEGAGETSDRGILSSYLRSDGRHEDMLYVDGGPSSTQTTGVVKMEGNKLFRQAVQMIAEAVRGAADQGGVGLSDIDLFVPHQANKRIIDAVAKKLGIAEENVVETIAYHGNTSAASIPLALTQAVADGRAQPGDLIMLEAMGGGLTWGACLLRY